MAHESPETRLALLEQDRTWIKESLARIELSQKEQVLSLTRHLEHHPRDTSNGNGNGGLVVIVGKKTAVALVTAVFGSGGVLWVLLGLPGVG